jgi:hypothetical protein
VSGDKPRLECSHQETSLAGGGETLLSYQGWFTSIEYKNLITLSDRKGCVGSQEFMAEDLGEEDIVGLVFGFELVATEGAVGLRK